MNFLKHIYSEHQKKIIFLLIIIIGHPLIMYVLNMMGPNIINALCIITVAIILSKKMNLKLGNDDNPLPSLLKLAFASPIMFLIGWVTGETVNLIVSEYYVWPPDDYEKEKLPKKIYNGGTLEAEVDRVNRFKDLVTLKQVQYASGEQGIFKIQNVKNSLCDGIVKRELIGDYITPDVDIFYILSPNSVGPLVKNPRTGNSWPSRVNICIQLERVDKIPNDVFTLDTLLKEENLGNIVLSKRIYGMTPINRLSIEKGNIDLNDSDIVPFKYCIEKQISYLRYEIGSFLSPSGIKYKTDHECKVNNLLDPNSSVMPGYWR